MDEVCLDQVENKPSSTARELQLARRVLETGTPNAENGKARGRLIAPAPAPARARLGLQKPAIKEACALASTIVDLELQSAREIWGS